VGIAAFAALLCILLWFPPLEAVLNNRSNHFELHLELTNSISLQDFVTVIRRLGLKIVEIEQNPAYVGSGLSVYSISITVSNEMLKKYKTHQEIIEALKSLDYVYHIEEMRS
jgi:putative Mg2+ transporter-C (MgtC) family protein